MGGGTGSNDGLEGCAASAAGGAFELGPVGDGSEVRAFCRIFWRRCCKPAPAAPGWDGNCKPGNGTAPTVARERPGAGADELGADDVAVDVLAGAGADVGVGTAGSADGIGGGCGAVAGAATESAPTVGAVGVVSALVLAAGCSALVDSEAKSALGFALTGSSGGTGGGTGSVIVFESGLPGVDSNLGKLPLSPANLAEDPARDRITPGRVMCEMDAILAASSGDRLILAGAEDAVEPPAAQRLPVPSFSFIWVQNSTCFAW